MSTHSDSSERSPTVAQQFRDENDCPDTTELDQDIKAGQKAADIVCQYVDWLLSTVNPNPPDQDMWIRPAVHPCQRSHHDNLEYDKQSGYGDLLNMVQRHTRTAKYSIIKLPYFLAVYHMVVKILPRYCIQYMHSSITSYWTMMIANDGH